MPKIVYPTVIKVEPRIYSTIRSFLDSSLKGEYPWNTGIVLPGTHTVLFTKKVFTKKGKWILNINHGSIILQDSKYNQALLIEKGRSTLTIKPGVYEDVENPDITYILPDPPVPYYIPLNLRDIMEKVEIYRQAYLEAVEPDTIVCARDCRTAFSPVVHDC
jgi:hypothetical protein